MEYLARVMAQQVAAITNRRLAARLRYARFTYGSSLAQFDFDFEPTCAVDRKLVEDLATLRFIDEHRPLLFPDQPACGKTHLAVALATRAVEAGYRATSPTPTTRCGPWCSLGAVGVRHQAACLHHPTVLVTRWR